MREEISKLLDLYYGPDRPPIADVHVLDESPDSGILCIRWRDGDRVVTVKSIMGSNEPIITELR